MAPRLTSSSPTTTSRARPSVSSEKQPPPTAISNSARRSKTSCPPTHASPLPDTRNSTSDPVAVPLPRHSTSAVSASASSPASMPLFGRSAVKAPTLNADAVKAIIAPDAFGPTAALLEDTGVAAYAGQGPNIKQKAVVKLALSIHSVEARHAAQVRLLRHQKPWTGAFDKPLSKAQVLAIAGPFIVG